MSQIISEFFTAHVFEYVEMYGEEKNNNLCVSITTVDHVYIYICLKCKKDTKRWDKAQIFSYIY